MTFLLRPTDNPGDPVAETLGVEIRLSAETVNFNQDRVSGTGRSAANLFRLCLPPGLLDRPLDGRSKTTRKPVQVGRRAFKTSDYDQRTFYAVADRQFDCWLLQIHLQIKRIVSLVMRSLSLSIGRTPKAQRSQG
jgi:hypothetical protein